MKLKILLIFLLFWFNCFAQKSLQYSSFFQGRHFQFVLKFTDNDRIYGHCIDFQEKSKHLIEGRLQNPGNIFELNCKDHPLFSFIRLKEDVNSPTNLTGFFYAPDAYTGHVNFSSRPEEFNFEENKDIETVNSLYRLMLGDFGFTPDKVSVPFQHDTESGLYTLNAGNGYAATRGIPASPRKLVLTEGLLHSFQEQRIDFTDGYHKQKLYFQVLGYTPYHSVMVISEESDAKISKAADTSYQITYKIAIYTLKAKEREQKESWLNETDKLLNQEWEAVIKEKLPHCMVEFNNKFLALQFNRKCRVTPAIPKTIIYVPEIIGSTKNKTLIFNWQNSKMVIE